VERREDPQTRSLWWKYYRVPGGVAGRSGTPAYAWEHLDTTQCVYYTVRVVCYIYPVRSMSDKSTQIHLKVSERSFLRDLKLPGETYGEAIIRLGQGKTVAVQIPVGLFNFLGQVAEGLKTETRVVDVSSSLGEMAAKFGAVSGFRGENFRDWGVQETAKATMITFLGIDNRFTLLSTVMTQSMNTLIAELGAKELEPVLEQALEAIASAFARLYPEEGG